MKNHTLRLEICIFSSIFLLFILPPFFAPVLNSNTSIFTEWTFPIQQFVNALVTGIIFYSLKDEKERIVFLRFPVLLTVGLLLCSSLVMKFIAELLKSNTDTIKVALPDSFINWIFCILTFLFSAFFEEVIYRFYFPDALYSLLNKKYSGKIIVIICEVTGCLVFAFAHYYLGILSVINAVFGHIILRVCYKKNKRLWPGVTAHFIYNIISLILL